MGEEEEEAKEDAKERHIEERKSNGQKESRYKTLNLFVMWMWTGQRFRDQKLPVQFLQAISSHISSLP